MPSRPAADAEFGCSVTTRRAGVSASGVLAKVLHRGCHSCHGIHMIWVTRERGTVMLDGLGMTPLAVKQGTDPAMRFGVARLGREHRAEGCHRLVIPMQPR